MRLGGEARPLYAGALIRGSTDTYESTVAGRIAEGRGRGGARFA